MTKKISITISDSVFAAIKKEAEAKGRDTLYHIQRILEEYAINPELMPDSAIQELTNFWRLVDEAVEVAVEIRDRDGLSSDITAKTFDACEKKKDWLRRYETYVNGPPKEKGNPKKGPINREIGYRIRARLDADVQKDSKGKTVNVKVNDSIIQSYSAFVPDQGLGNL